MTAAEIEVLRFKASRESWGLADAEVLSSDSVALAAGNRIIVLGPLLAHAEEGERLRVELELDVHARWGSRWKIDRQESLGLSPRGAWGWLAKLDGVGPILAARIQARFEDELLEVLSNPADPDPLLEVRGVGPGTVAKIRASWDGVRSTVDVESWRYLARLGLSKWETNRVLGLAASRKVRAEELLRENPYDVSELEGFGFVRADRIARAAGVSPESPARAEAAVRHILAEAVRASGDTCARLEDVALEAAGLTGQSPSLTREALERLPSIHVRRSSTGEWVHPKRLLEAESFIARIAQGGAPR